MCKTADYLRISDWSSYVFSSELPFVHRFDLGQRPAGVGRRAHRRRTAGAAAGVRPLSNLQVLPSFPRKRRVRVFAGMMALVGLLLALPAFAQTAPTPAPSAHDSRIVFPASVSQGALVFGKVPANSVVEYAGRTLRPTPYGTVVFGVDRREQGPLRLEVLRPDGTRTAESIAVTARDWPLEDRKSKRLNSSH